MSERPRLRFVTRQGCTLCESALEELRSAAAGRIDIEVVDVDTNDELEARFGATVPVVLSASGDVLAAGPLNAWRARVLTWRARLGGGD